MTKLFIVHGWTYSLDKWVEVCKSLEGKGFEVVQLKVPGLTTPSDKAWDIDGYVEWLGDELKSEDNPIVIGHSNGGRIALAFINKYPDKIGRLILIDSAGVAHNQLLPRTKLKTLRAISKTGKVLTKNATVKKVFYKFIGAQDYLNAKPNMKKTMQNMLSADQAINLSKVGVPTTIIWGREDAITPLKDGQVIHKAIDGSKLFIIDDARHSPFWNHADEVADIITNSVGDQA